MKAPFKNSAFLLPGGSVLSLEFDSFVLKLKFSSLVFLQPFTANIPNHIEIT